jgi:hypothetical protein
MRLQQHIEDKYLHEHDHSYHIFLEVIVGANTAIVLREAYLFHLEGTPETTHHKAAPSA